MEKTLPERTCVACRNCKPKCELIRVVRSKDGKVFVDASGKAAGRGAYVCNSAACIALAQKKRCFNRAFSMEIPQELYEELNAYANHEN